MNKLNLMVSMMALVFATHAAPAFADDDDDSSYSSDTSSETYEAPEATEEHGNADAHIFEDAAEDYVKQHVEGVAADALGEAAGESVKYYWAAGQAIMSDDPNKTVDVVRDLAIEAVAGPIVGGIFKTTDTAPAYIDEDTSGPLFQPEPEEDHGGLEIEPVTDDETAAIYLSSSTETSTPAPAQTYTPPPSYTPAPAPAPTYTPPAPTYSSGGRGVMRAE